MGFFKDVGKALSTAKQSIEGVFSPIEEYVEEKVIDPLAQKIVSGAKKTGEVVMEEVIEPLADVGEGIADYVELEGVPEFIPFVDVPGIKDKMEDIENNASDIVNTYNIPLKDFSKQNFSDLEDFYMDNVITEQEQQKINEMPDIYKEISNRSNNIQELQYQLYSDKILQADSPEKKELMSKFNDEIKEYDRLITRYDELKPGQRLQDEGIKEYQKDYSSQFYPSLIDIEKRFGKNSDISNALNEVVQRQTYELVNDYSEGLKSGFLDDPKVKKQYDKLYEAKTKEINYIINKAKQEEVSNYVEFREKLKDDSTMMKIQKQVADLEEDYRISKMKKGVVDSFKDVAYGDTYLGRFASYGKGILKTLETGFGYIERGGDEILQNITPVAAGDLSKIWYISDQDSTAKKYFGKSMNFLARSAPEILTTVATVFTGTTTSVLGKVGKVTRLNKVPLVGKLLSTASKANNLTKLGNTQKLTRLQKWINTGKNITNVFVREALIKGPAIDGMIAYNFAPSLTDEVIEKDLFWNVAPDIIFSGVSAGVKGYIKNQGKIVDAEAARKFIDIKGTYELPEEIYGQIPKLKSKGIDIIEDGGKYYAQAPIKEIIGNKFEDFAKIFSTDTAKGGSAFIDMAQSFIDGIKTGDKVSDSGAKQFIEIMVDKFKGTGKMSEKTAKNILEGIKTKDGLVNKLEDMKRLANTTTLSQIEYIDKLGKAMDISSSVDGKVNLENLSAIVDSKQAFIEDLAKGLEGTKIAKNQEDVVNSIVKKVEATGKISDDDVMGLVRAYNSSYKRITDAGEYMRGLNNFITESLGKAPKSLKSVQELTKLTEKIGEDFISNLKKAGIKIQFSGSSSKGIKEGIGGITNGQVAIVSLLKDFYKNPEDFTVGLIHELSHNLETFVAKDSELYKQLNKEYIKDINSWKDKLGFDISNIGPLEEGKLSKQGFSENEINYLKTFGARYRNLDEYISYGISEAIIGKKTNETISALEKKVKTFYNSTFENTKTNQELFKKGADSILNSRFQVNVLDENIARDIDYVVHTYASYKDTMSNVIDFFKKTSKRQSILELEKSWDMMSIEQSMNLIKTVDDEAYRTIQKMIDDNIDPKKIETFKDSVFNGYILGLKGNDALVSGLLYDSIVKYSDYSKGFKIPDGLFGDDMVNFVADTINSGSTKFGRMGSMLEDMSNYTKNPEIQSALLDMSAVTDYYRHIDNIKLIDEGLKKMPDNAMLGALRTSEMDKIDDLMFGKSKVLDKFGITSKNVGKGYSGSMKEIISNLSKKIGTENTKILDYFYRNVSKGLKGTKEMKVGVGLWSDLVKKMGFKNMIGTDNINDFFGTMAENFLKISEDKVTSYYGLGKLFGFEDNILKGDFQNIFRNAIKDNDSIFEALTMLKKKNTKLSKTLYNTSEKDIIDFLKFPYGSIIENNVEDLFKIVYNNFNINYADEISDRIIDVMQNKIDKNILENSMNKIQEFATKRDSAYVAFKESQGQYLGDFVKKDIGELSDLARDDYYYKLDGNITGKLSDGTHYEVNKYGEVGSWNDNIMEATKGSEIKDFNDINNAVFNQDYISLFEDLGVKQGDFDGLNKFVDNVEPNMDFIKADLSSKGIRVDEFLDKKYIPIGETEVNKYRDLFETLSKKYPTDQGTLKYITYKTNIGKIVTTASKEIDLSVVAKRKVDKLNNINYVVNKYIDRIEDTINKGNLDQAKQLFSKLADIKTPGGKFLLSAKRFGNTATELRGTLDYLKSAQVELLSDFIRQKVYYGKGLKNSAEKIPVIKNLLKNNIGDTAIINSVLNNMENLPDLYKTAGADEIWRESFKAKNLMERTNLKFDLNNIDNAKDSLANVINAKLYKSGEKVEDIVQNIDGKFVRPGIYEMRYKRPDGIDDVYYINMNKESKLFEEQWSDLEGFLDKQFDGTTIRGEIELGEDLFYKYENKLDDYTPEMEADGYNILDYSANDRMLANIYDKYRPELEEWDNFTKQGEMFSKINSFLLTNIENIRDYAPDAYKYVNGYENMALNIASKFGNIEDMFGKYKKVFKEFTKEVNENLDFITNSLFLKKIIKNKPTMVDELLTLMKEGKIDFEVNIESTLKELGLNPGSFGKKNLSEVVESFRKHKLGIKESKANSLFGFNSGVMYAFKEMGIENTLKGYNNNIVNDINDYLNVYVDGFQNVYKGMGIDIDKDMILGIFKEKFFNSNKFDLIDLNNELVSGIGFLDSLTATIKGRLEKMLDPDAYKLKSLDELLHMSDLSESVIKRIKGDITGESVFPKGTAGKVWGFMKRMFYSVNLSWISPKVYTIGFQNIVQVATEVPGKINKFSEDGTKILELLQNTANRDDELGNFMRTIISKKGGLTDHNMITLSALRQVEQSKGNLFKKMINPMVDYMSNLANKFGVDITKYKQTIGASLESPMGLADEIGNNKTLAIMTADHAANTLGITSDDLLAMLSKYDELGEQAKKLSGAEKMGAMAKRKEIFDTYTGIWRRMKNEASFEVSKVYKATAIPGLSRNGFSRNYFLNTFSSWGSKKVGEYMNDLIYKPVKKAMFAGKVGGPAAFAKTLTKELVFNPYVGNLLRTNSIFMKGMYKMSKKDDLEFDDKTFFQQIFKYSPLGQGLQSFFITRGIIGAKEGFDTVMRNGGTMSEGMQEGTYQLVGEFSRQFMKEVTFLAGPIIGAPLKEMYENPDATFDDYVDLVSDIFKKKLASNIYYGATDMYNGFSHRRLDDMSENFFFDMLYGDTVTKYKGDMEKMIDDVYYSKKLEDGKLKINWLDSINGLMSLPENYAKQFRVDQLKELTDGDKTYKAIKNLDFTGVEPGVKEKLLNEYFSYIWGSKFNLDMDKSTEDGKVGLILNELSSQGIDTSALTMYIQNGNLKKAEQELAILQSTSLTKSKGAVLLSYAAKKYWSDLSKQYTKAGVKLSDYPELKSQLMAGLAEQVLPAAAKLDKDIHADILMRYIQTAYGGKIPGLPEVTIGEDGSASFAGGAKSTLTKYIRLGLLAEVADLEAVEFDRKIIQNAGALMLQDVPDDKVAKQTAEYFNFVDDLKTVGEGSKSIAKASVLYGNLDRIKVLLNSKYGAGMADEMEKLSEIIWNESSKLEISPELLDGLLGSPYGKKGKKFKPANIDLPKVVFDGVRELKKAVKDNPKLYDHIKTKTLNSIRPKLQNIDLPQITKRKDEFEKIQLKPIRTKPLKTKDLKVAKGEVETRKVKIKAPKIKGDGKQKITKPKLPKFGTIRDRG